MAINTNYISTELIHVAPLPIQDGENGQFKLQLVSDSGRTKWLNISKEQMEAIEWILLGIKLIKQ